ncbi:MAG: hypothetical protein PHX27_03920 [Candidatus ainarchaeum sp.]|nr:hypothetical protein [Candidatus ainarchaeum sp.]
MIPEAELIRNEFIIREMDFPENISFTKNSLLRWCCLSLGLISKNETRDKAFAIFDVLFTFIFTKKINPTTIDILEELEKKHKIKTSEKLIRYHLNRLINLKIILRDGIKYKINPSPNSDKRNSIAESYKAWITKQVIIEMDKNFTALEKLQKAYEK